MLSYDDMLSGMLLVVWYYGVLDVCFGCLFFVCFDNF